MKYLAVVLLLAGCAATKPLEVLVEVPVPCVPEAKPARPINTFGARSGNPAPKTPAQKAEAVRELAREAIRWEEYAGKLEVIVAGCETIKRAE